MIKITKLQIAGDRILALEFNDGSMGHWCGEDIIARDTVLTRPLADRAYFARAFLEAGALAWPNGLELSPAALYERLEAAGQLVRRAA